MCFEAHQEERHRLRWLNLTPAQLELYNLFLTSELVSGADQPTEKIIPVIEAEEIDMVRNHTDIRNIIISSGKKSSSVRSKARGGTKCGMEAGRQLPARMRGASARKRRWFASARSISEGHGMSFEEVSGLASHPKQIAGEALRCIAMLKKLPPICTRYANLAHFLHQGVVKAEMCTD